jgi:hypothetical protein
MFTRTSRWVPTYPGYVGHVWIGFEPQLQADASIPGQAARKGSRNEGRNLVLESEPELLLLAREGVQELWADEDEEYEEGDEESDELE